MWTYLEMEKERDLIVETRHLQADITNSSIAAQANHLVACDTPVATLTQASSSLAT